MTTFKQFLLTEDRTDKIDEQQAINWIKQYCPQYAKRVIDHGPQIYRGLEEKDQPLLFGDSSKSQPRTSANTMNHYTLLVDELLPAWQNFPKRSYSFICASTEEIAANYDIPYAVFPADNTTIGLANKEDFWLSFPYMRNHLGRDVTLNEFNELLQIIFEVASEENIPDSGPRTIEQLKQMLNQAQKAIHQQGDEFIEQIVDSQNPRINAMSKPISNLFEYIEINHNNKLIDGIADLMSPKKNGFQMGVSQRIVATDEVEMWFSGSALFVGVDYYSPQHLAQKALNGT